MRRTGSLILGTDLGAELAVSRFKRNRRSIVGTSSHGVPVAPAGHYSTP
jgi:hypothetical protein